MTTALPQPDRRPFQTWLSAVFVWGVWALMTLELLDFIGRYGWNFPCVDDHAFIRPGLIPGNKSRR